MSRTESSAEESASLARTIGVGQAKTFKTISEMVAHPDIDALDMCSKLHSYRSF